MKVAIRLFFITLVGLLVLTIFQSYLHAGLPYTHDGENHVARFANYAIAIKEGQFPPRFAPNLFSRYGYPVFNYNYPLANILSLPFSFFNVSYEVTFKVLSIFAIIIGLVGLAVYNKQLRYTYAQQLCSILLYLTPIYLLNLILYRGSIGEILVYGLIPWLFLTLEWCVRANYLRTITSIIGISIWTSFFLSHNVSVLFGSVLLGCFSIQKVFSLRRSTELCKQYCYNFGCTIVFSILLSLWFWLPALAELPLISVADAKQASEYALHFPTFQQFLSTPISFGYSLKGPVDTLSFSLGIFQILALSALVLKVSMFAIQKRSVRVLLTQPESFYLCVIGVLLFIQLNESLWLWQLLPGLSLIQFPWRLSLFIVALIPLIPLQWFKELSKRVQLLIILIVMLALSFTYNMYKPVDYRYQSNETYEQFSQSTSTSNENVPKTFTYIELGNWQPAPEVQGMGTSTVIFWNGSTRIYQLELTEQSIIIEPTMYFAGWETSVNGEKISYINTENIQGRIAYELPAGTYTVTTIFTQNTPARVVGNLLSASMLLLLVIYILRQYSRYRNEYFRV